MSVPTQSDLISAIADAAKRAFSSLFNEHPGSYYYCTLITSGEAHAPVIAAWSREALSDATAVSSDRVSDMLALKWSYANSPYYCYGEGYFEKVNRLFSQRPTLNHELTEEEWNAEYQLRLNAMEAAMARLDEEGIFGVGDARNKMVVLVEVMPPDYTNVERARRLNPPDTLRDWLVEAAESEDH